MDVRYGVDVSNKFDIIGLNDDAAEAARQKDEVRKTKKPLEGDKPKLGSNKQNTKKSTPHLENKGKPNDQYINKKEVQGKDSQQSERSNRGGRGNREPRDNKENDGERKPFRRPPREQQENRGGDENVPPEFREKPEGGSRFNRFDDGERGRGRGRGRGGFRGRGGRGGERGGGFGQPFESRGKRDFDRHSGSDKTGVKAVDKREGGGRRNWGSFKDDIKNIEESVQPSMESTEPAENWNQNEDNVEPQENSETTPGAPEIVNEEDAAPKQMTLKEYRATQGKSRLKSQFQIRKAGEGVDGSQWKTGTKCINKPVVSAPKQERRRRASESEEEESGDEHEDHEERKKKNKNTLNIEITFNDNNRRGGRGGRRGRGPGRGFYRGGSPRGGGGRGGDRKYREAAPRVDDEKDFPSLVKSVA
ncbi:plasminogen activator inhibitor 1 RNA-binding protein isoform X1 [Patella vulgata]|uniref:plasminogen activator inhibitor 1 RNA-binding protein isoform X1 n=1 Tax=Patella vulgata TaxID=6465 RepID=UPI0021808876|nr:plasminogen activator inhibitor 1 RNA-binding protein isoform X1 [Patella vulgata]